MRIIADAAAGKRLDGINTLIVPNKCGRATGSSCMLRPTDSQMAKIIRLRGRQLTLDNSNTPGTPQIIIAGFTFDINMAKIC